MTDDFITAFYRAHLKRYGTEDIRGMGWHDEAEYALRFSVACSLVDLKGSRILDVGCGYGGLHGHLTAEKIPISSYLGVDLLGEMIEAARTKHPTGNFAVMNILDEDPGSFDHVFCLGAMNITAPGYGDVFRAMLARMATIAEKSAIVSFLSDKRVLVKGPYHFEDPQDISEELEKEGWRVRIHRDKRLSGEHFLVIR